MDFIQFLLLLSVIQINLFIAWFLVIEQRLVLMYVLTYSLKTSSFKMKIVVFNQLPSLVRLWWWSNKYLKLTILLTYSIFKIFMGPSKLFWTKGALSGYRLWILSGQKHLTLSPLVIRKIMISLFLRNGEPLILTRLLLICTPLTPINICFWKSSDGKRRAYNINNLTL